MRLFCPLSASAPRTLLFRCADTAGSFTRCPSTRVAGCSLLQLSTRALPRRRPFRLASAVLLLLRRQLPASPPERRPLHLLPAAGTGTRTRLSHQVLRLSSVGNPDLRYLHLCAHPEIPTTRT